LPFCHKEAQNAQNRSSFICALCAFLWRNPNHMRAGKWIKRLGFWGFLFFLVKGLLWLLIPALLAFWASS